MEVIYPIAVDNDYGVWDAFSNNYYASLVQQMAAPPAAGADSRAPLRAAPDGFDALSFATLAETARQELRASGETSRRRTPEAWDQLTPQELQSARMAAEGLFNREIGQQLYLSHRTVGYHLHRIFPKLGITSRSQLHAALSG